MVSPRKTSLKIPIAILTITLFVTLSHLLYRDLRRSTPVLSSSPFPTTSTTTAVVSLSLSLSSPPVPSFSSPAPSSNPPPPPPPSPPPPLFSPPPEPLSSPPPAPSPSLSLSLSTTSILIPDWEVLVLVGPETGVNQTKGDGEEYACVYRNGETSPARFAGELPFKRGTAFKCEFPPRNRRKLPFLQPRLVKKDKILQEESSFSNDQREMLRWNGMTYDTFVTENDVVLLVKGVNTRQGMDRPPLDFRCVFWGGDHDPLTAVKTPVTSSVQEVFRCPRPKELESTSRKVNVSIEYVESNWLVPSVALYAPQERRTVEFTEEKAIACACTMVYNVGKFLREWVTYHASIGVEKFILYDNDSDDDLYVQVSQLRKEGYDIRTVYWPWPKTQEAGFSHCALFSEEICRWVAFVDVDEFILSPHWLDFDLHPTRPKGELLSSTLLPKGSETRRVGQVSIKCMEFGPSSLTANPSAGVTQGYTCRRRFEQRHKSIVLLEAIDHSMLNVIHHFKIKEGYRSIQVGSHRAVVNHYKYQAWPEFRAKFRRRVSAYVVDWRQSLNPMSNDRAPGLGFEPVEPPGWAERFCEVKDERLKELTRRWFGVNESTMAWQTA